MDSPPTAGNRISSRNYRFLVTAVGLTYLACFFWLFRCRDIVQRAVPFDDAFVSFRYAQNLAAGAGLTYNPGEAPVEGYSNFLEVMLLAPLARRVGDLPLAGVWHGLVFMALTGLLLLWFAAHRRSVVALAVPFLLLLDPLLRCHAWNGLETTQYAFIAAAAAIALHRARRTDDRRAGWAAGLICGVGALSRPEFPLWLAIYFYLEFLIRPTAWRTTGREQGRVAAGFAFVFLPYEVWRAVHFQSLISSAVLLKYAELGDGFGVIAGGGFTCLALFLTRDPLFVALAAVAGALAVLAPASRKNELGVFVLAGALTAGLTGVDWVHMYASLRLFAPLTVLGALWLIEAAGSLRAAGLAKALAAVAIGVAAAIAFGLCQSWRPAIPKDAQMPPVFHVADFFSGADKRLTAWTTRNDALSSADAHNLHRVAANWICERFDAHARVASENAGGFGYFLDRPFVDLEGLIDPVVARLRANRAPAAAFIAHWRRRGIDCLAHYSVAAEFDDDDLRRFVAAEGFHLAAVIRRNDSPQADRYWVFARQASAAEGADLVCADPPECHWTIGRRNIITAAD